MNPAPDSDTCSSSSDTPIRVLMADLPAVMADILANKLRTQRDIQVVGSVQGTAALLTAAVGADIVILGAPPAAALPGVCRELLSAFPAVRILTIDPRDDTLVRYWLGLRSTRPKPPHGLCIAEDVRQLFRQDPLV